MSADLDLAIERLVPLRPAQLYAGWTRPELIKRWFCPAPWSVSDCEVDLRPGGLFRTVMRSPEGKEFPNLGCWLEIVPERRLVWTDALQPGFRPAPEPFITGVIDFLPEGTGTRYRARALHASAAARDRHAAMGFAEGWNKALDQLIALGPALG